MARLARARAWAASALGAALGAAMSLAIVACGPSDKPASPPASAKPAATAQAAAQRDQAQSAEQVAQQARAELRCPAKIVTPARAAAAPVDDVQGVRPGLAYDEALNAVLCTHELLLASPAHGRGFNLKAPEARQIRQGFTARHAEPHVVKTSRQIMQEMQAETIARGGNTVREDLKPGQSKWFVSTMGLPGQERVVSVAREERFAAGQNPPLETVTAALVKKYGPLTQDLRATPGRLPTLRWAYDPMGRLINETSPLFHKCQGSSDPDGGNSLSPDCGIVVQALVVPLRSNAELADSLQVGVVDQARGYEWITEAEQGLAQADAQRRAAELAKAAKNAKAPSL